MDRDTNSRRQSSRAASRAASRPRRQADPPPRQAMPPKRGLGSRVGLEKRAPEPRRSGKYRRPSASGAKAQPSAAEPRRETDTLQYTPPGRKGSRPGQAARPQSGQPRRGAAGSQPRRQPSRRPAGSASRNPQKAAYRPGAPHHRRVTQVEKMRIRRRRRVVGVLCTLGLLAAGVLLAVNLLFKVTDFRVENLDRSTPADTGIYTEQQIIDLLGVQAGDNLFGFSQREKSRQLQAQLPYLDVVEVGVQPPGTVVIKVQPATERYVAETDAGWLVLSDGLKVLRVSGEQPDGLILLDAALDPARPQTPGSYLSLLDTTPVSTAESALAVLGDGEEDKDDGETADDVSSPAQEAPATPESAEEPEASRVDETLSLLVEKLEEWQVLDKVTMISLRDLEELSFLYDGRVSTLLGTANNLDYKLRFASNIILDVDGRGLTATDHGTLDVSYQRSDGSIAAYFTPAEPAATPAPSPTPEPAGDGTASNPDA